jgi:hypothetical protein
MSNTSFVNGLGQIEPSETRSAFRRVIWLVYLLVHTERVIPTGHLRPSCSIVIQTLLPLRRSGIWMP